jgi:hypothetical protein
MLFFAALLLDLFSFGYGGLSPFNWAEGVVRPEGLCDLEIFLRVGKLCERMFPTVRVGCLVF